MPYYDYQCECGEVVEIRRPVAERDDPARCQQCGQPAYRKEAFSPILLRSKPVPAVRNPLHSDGCPCCPAAIK